MSVILKTIIILSLFLNFSIFAQTQSTFIKDALSKWKGMKSYTLEVAEAMPKEKFFHKPVDDENTFAFQLE